MLRELKLPSLSSSIKAIKEEKERKVNIDSQVACEIVDILYESVLLSIRMDRSQVKLKSFTKGVIGGVLGKTREGTKEYIRGMTDSDIKVLLNNIEKELKKRR